VAPVELRLEQLRERRGDADLLRAVPRPRLQQQHKGSRWCAPGLKGDVVDHDQLVVALVVGKVVGLKGLGVSSSA
jgi:hypothetical protein